MQFSVDQNTGQVSVQNLCSVKNHNAGELVALLQTEVTLKCSTESNVGSVTYEWTKDGVIILDDDVRGELVLQVLDHETKGGYACKAKNLAGSLQSETTQLIVHGELY